MECSLDITVKRALAAAARAFAEEMERDLPADPGPGTGLPVPGSSRSMLEVLRSVAGINDDLGRGATDEDMRDIAHRAGMDPRGMAGYYAANLLEKRADGTRWVSGPGRDRLDRLAALSGVPLLDPAGTGRAQPASSHAGQPAHLDQPHGGQPAHGESPS
jgi:hypothetical protein